MATIRRNGLYGDPNLAAAFDNLSEVFKTPSGADVLGYTKAGAEREKADRLAELYNYAKDPNFNQQTFDRIGVAAGNYTPIQSYYAQDQNNATTRRNADVAAKATTDVAGIQARSALQRQFAQPIYAKDGETVFLPPGTAAATGLPSQFRGNITAGQGQVVTTPSGETISGPAKPATDSEVKGAILRGLPAGDQRAVAMQGVGTSQVLDKKGEPTFVFTSDAAGRTPYNVDNRQPQLGNYKTGDGKAGTAMFDKDSNRWKDTQTGVDIPAGAQILAAPGTQVNIETKAPSKIEDAYGEGIGNQIKTVLDNAGTAPRNLAEIAQFRDALDRAGDNITTGPLSSYVLKGKQALGGLLGSNFEGVPEAELINNIGFKLATAAARGISSRPTQFEFGQALATKPGLALSKPGMLAMLNIMEQNAKDDQALAALANDPANRQSWTATVQKYYAEHPIMSPFAPGKPLGQADIDELSRRVNTSGGAPSQSAPPAAAVQYLRQNPALAADFDAKYGAGAASQFIGAR